MELGPERKTHRSTGPKSRHPKAQKRLWGRVARVIRSVIAREVLVDPVVHPVSVDVARWNRGSVRPNVKVRARKAAPAVPLQRILIWRFEKFAFALFFRARKVLAPVGSGWRCSRSPSAGIWSMGPCSSNCSNTPSCPRSGCCAWARGLPHTRSRPARRPALST